MLMRHADYQRDLNEFYQHFTDIPNGTTPIDLSIDGGQRPPTVPHAIGWPRVGGESNLDLQSALPIIYPQNATIYQVDDRYYAHQVDYGYHGLELFNTFLDAVSTVFGCGQSIRALTGRCRSMARTARMLRSAKPAMIQNTTQNILILTSTGTRGSYSAAYSSPQM